MLQLLFSIAHGRSLLLITLGILLRTLVMGQVHAQSASKSDWVTFCSPTGDEHRRAESALNAFKRRFIDSIDSGRSLDVQDARSAFSSLIQGPCFEIALADQYQSPKVLSIASFRMWWESGGYEWLRSILNSKQASAERVNDRSHSYSVVLPPSERTFLDRSSHPLHPLSPLYCPVNDKGCGQEVNTWRRLADVDLQGRYALKPRSFQRSELEGSTQKSLLKCYQRASSLPVETRYRRWLSCIRQAFKSSPAVPIGRFQAPSQGTLLLFESGKNGVGCLRARAYDLATGGAFLSEECYQAPRANQSRKKEQTVRSEKSTGVVSRSALSRALWMLMSADQMETDIHVRSVHVLVPQGIQPRWRRDSEPEPIEDASFGLGMGGTSHYRILAWAWLDKHRGLSSGELHLHDFNSVAHGYALDLLKIAEASFRPGCSPVSPPSELKSYRYTGIIDRFLEMFDDQWAGWSRGDTCKPIKKITNNKETSRQ